MRGVEGFFIRIDWFLSISPFDIIVCLRMTKLSHLPVSCSRFAEEATNLLNKDLPDVTG